MRDFPTGGVKNLKRIIYAMDELRGFAVFCMVFYHAFYTLAFLFRLPWGEALFRFDDNMEVEPWLAESYEV